MATISIWEQGEEEHWFIFTGMGNRGPADVVGLQYPTAPTSIVSTDGLWELQTKIWAATVIHTLPEKSCPHQAFKMVSVEGKGGNVKKKDVVGYTSSLLPPNK